MIQIIVLLKIKDMDAFYQFETRATHIMKQYGGELFSAFQTNLDESTLSRFDEVHYLHFPDLDSFKMYQKDTELLKLSALREKAIANTELIVSGELKAYTN